MTAGRKASSDSTKRRELLVPSTVFVVDADLVVRDMVGEIAASASLECEGFGTASAFLAAYDPQRPGCLVLDVSLPGISGLDLQATLRAKHAQLPVIAISGYADVPTAVRALRAGALDFLEKPLAPETLLERIKEAIELDRRERHAAARFADFSARVVRLTPRERQVLELIVEGRANRQIAEALVLSRKTVETHRANLISKTGVESLAELIRFGLQMTVPAPRSTRDLGRRGGWPPDVR